MLRRRFVKNAIGSTIAGGAALTSLHGRVDAASGHPTYGGPDLQGWQTVLGDGLYTAPGLPPVNINDISTNNNGSKSTLWANDDTRGVMAHNITYMPIADTQALNYTHVAGYRFRLPYIPLTWNSPYNAQTFEGGLFIWDGANTRCDYGLAFQWILNPWMSSFGSIRTWASDNSSQWWQDVAYLQPDMNWHTVQYAFNKNTQAASILIDGNAVPCSFTKTPKDGWGTEVAARLQVELISIWPGNNPSAPSHLADVADWYWNWNPA